MASVNVDIKNEYKQFGFSLSPCGVCSPALRGCVFLPARECRLRKAIMETSLALCTKREAVQLAALAMRLDIAHEECRTKKPKEELDLYKREKVLSLASACAHATKPRLIDDPVCDAQQKPSLGQYYSPHWLNVSEPSELAAELLYAFALLRVRASPRPIDD